MDSCYFNGDTPLHVAAANGNLKDVMHLLDKRKACLFVRNSFWKKPIDVVEENILFLKKRKGQPCNETMIEHLNTIKDLIGNATHKAMDQHTDIDKDASFEKRSKEERLFLFQIRVFRGDILAIRRFLKTDATLINQLDYDDRSALHIAAAAGHTHLVEFLLNQEADKNKKDRYNMTPLDEAKMNGDDEMIDMLKG
ncbi:Hypothetical predicted protein [Mytilus galloprovincialis]|nr:Hypothetical predicted protein [Mytilus galloprovincialis]